MKLQLTTNAKHLDVEVDDIVAGLLAACLNLPEGADHRNAIARHLSGVSAPWVLDEGHMRKRVLRRLILEIADPTLLMRHLIVDQRSTYQLRPGRRHACQRGCVECENAAARPTMTAVLTPY